MALNSLFCADVPLSNYSLTHAVGVSLLLRLQEQTAAFWNGVGSFVNLTYPLLWHNDNGSNTVTLAKVPQKVSKKRFKLIVVIVICRMMVFAEKPKATNKYCFTVRFAALLGIFRISVLAAKH